LANIQALLACLPVASSAALSAILHRWAPIKGRCLALRLAVWPAGLLVRFKGIETPEQAGQFRNQWVYIKASEVPRLPEGKIYQHELLGFQVVDENEQLLGDLVEILETGANNVYVVRNASGGEILLPVIPPVILETDPARRIIRVHLLEGL